MKWVPFVAHVEVTPYRGTRVETLRALQKLATLAYTELSTDATLNIATPGGGQFQSFGGTDGGGTSGITQGFSIKPQIGASPPAIKIAGFNTSSDENIQVQPSTQIYSGGTVYSGYKSHPHDSTPTSAFDAEVKALRTKLIAAMTSAFPTNTPFSILRIEYGNVVYGDGGYHFPQ